MIIEPIAVRKSDESAGLWNFFGVKFNGRLFVWPATSLFIAITVVSFGAIFKLSIAYTIPLVAWLPIVTTLYVLALVNGKPAGYDADFFQNLAGNTAREISYRIQKLNPFPK